MTLPPLQRPGLAVLDPARYRVSFPAMGQQPPWFEALLDAYAFLDAAMNAEVAAGDRSPACGEGCDACCRQPIPATLAEIMGIQRYLKAYPYGGRGGGAGTAEHCRFLADGRCSVYPVRPFACRRYIVFSKPCVPGEDATVSRPSDVLAPSRGILLHALRMTLPLYRMLGIAADEDAAMDFFAARMVLLHTVGAEVWGKEENLPQK